MVELQILARLAELRHAVAGEVIAAEGLVAIRNALRRVFAKVTLVRTPDGLVLVPEVATFSEIESWAQLAGGRSAVKPKPERLAVPGSGLATSQEGASKRSSSRPLFAPLFGPIPVGA